MARRGNFSLQALEVDKYLKAVKDEAREIMQDIAVGGKWEMERVIETSTTPTGEARAERGGHPGRIDSGNMIDEVEARVEEYPDGFAAVWGWPDPQDYYLLQNDGTEANGLHPGVPEMEALEQSLSLSEMDIAAKLRGMS